MVKAFQHRFNPALKGRESKLFCDWIEFPPGSHPRAAQGKKRRRSETLALIQTQLLLNIRHNWHQHTGKAEAILRHR